VIVEEEGRMLKVDFEGVPEYHQLVDFIRRFLGYRRFLWKQCLVSPFGRLGNQPF